jgi:uncharacterized membrane protein SirB2
MYAIIKNIHVLAVLISIAGFILRGVWMMRESGLLDRKPVRVLPHIVDTVLLVTAIWLTVLIGQYPFSTSWLTAKLVALIVYIALGMIAIRRGKTRRQRIIAFGLALLTAAYILLVAVTRNPLPFA